MASNLDYTTAVTTIDGKATTLEEYEGKVLLIVNTASECGFTPQFDGLEELWKTYKEQGLVVLGFPCNQFGGQDPGSADEIAQFCRLNFGVTFPMHEKVDVNGKTAHPLFSQLKSGARGLLGSESIKWNFTKFLVDRKGQIRDRFAPKDTPKSLASAIERVLAE